MRIKRRDAIAWNNITLKTGQWEKELEADPFFVSLPVMIICFILGVIIF